jgi:hypothetical protein
MKDCNFTCEGIPNGLRTGELVNNTGKYEASFSINITMTNVKKGLNIGIF